MSFSQNDLVSVSREVEVTPGVVTGGARDRTYGTGPTFTPTGNTNTSGIITGDGGIKSVRAALRAADAEIPSELIYELHDGELEDALRDTFAGSEATGTGISVTFDQTGTHEDGTAGPVITAAAGVLNAFLTSAGCMLEVTGAGVNAANKRPRLIKAVKADGTKIDIDSRFTAGTVGAISEPLVDEGPVTATLRCGDAIRNQGIENIRSINLEFQFTDQAGGSFVMVKGLKSNGFKLGIDGKGIVTISFMYMGMDYDDPTTATQGNGTVNANAAVDNPSMTGAEDLTYFLVNGKIQIAGDNLTNFSLDCVGNASGIDETCGSRNRPGVTVGDLDFTGSLTILHEHTKLTLLSALARAGTLAPLHWKLVDPLGNWYWMGLLETLLEPASAKPGAKGSRTNGQFNFKTQLGSAGRRTFVLQKFAAA